MSGDVTCLRLLFAHTTGTEDQRLLVVKIRGLNDSSAMAVFDSKGKVLYGNTPLASMLGYSQRELQGQRISSLLPPPYGSMHTVWVQVSGPLNLIGGSGRILCRLLFQLLWWWLLQN